MKPYGYVDTVKNNIVYGWAVNKNNIEKKCQIVACQHGNIISETIANIYRQDLEQEGLGDGCYGFELLLPDIGDAQNVVQILEKESLIPLQNSPVLINNLSPQFDSKIASPHTLFHLADDASNLCFESNAYYDRISNEIKSGQAIKVVARELSNMMTILKNNEKELRRLNAIVEVQSAAMGMISDCKNLLPDAISISADMILSGGSGFHDLEWDHERIPFRWTGPENVSALDVFVERRKNKILSLVFLRNRQDGLESHCKIMVDGVEVGAQIKEQDKYIAFESLLYPSGLSRKTRVSIISPQMFTPGQNDMRKLGIAFHRILVRDVQNL